MGVRLLWGQQHAFSCGHYTKNSASRVEQSAPRRVRPPPRQTVRAVFPHTAFHVKLTLSRTPFPHLIQPHCLPFVIIRLRILELIPTLARVLREDDEPIPHIFVHPVEPPVGMSAQEVVRPPRANSLNNVDLPMRRLPRHATKDAVGFCSKSPRDCNSFSRPINTTFLLN